MIAQVVEVAILPLLLFFHFVTIALIAAEVLIGLSALALVIDDMICEWHEQRRRAIPPRHAPRSARSPVR